MVSVRQPFDPEKFNFNKVEPDKELVFETQQDKEDICIINVSPIEFGHCLFLPQGKYS
jgi:GDP-D-glucose phosphorylase